MNQKPERLYLLAQEIAERTSGFFTPLGAGGGNIRSNAFMSELRSSAKQVFGQDYSEAKVCGDNKLAIDFHFPDEETAVEIAGLLGESNSEYEKDIFKCLVAQDRGCKIRRLMFIAKPGAAKVHSSPGREAIAQFVMKHLAMEITLDELVNPALEPAISNSPRPKIPGRRLFGLEATFRPIPVTAIRQA